MRLQVHICARFVVREMKGGEMERACDASLFRPWKHSYLPFIGRQPFSLGSLSPPPYPLVSLVLYIPPSSPGLTMMMVFILDLPENHCEVLDSLFSFRFTTSRALELCAHLIFRVLLFSLLLRCFCFRIFNRLSTFPHRCKCV